MYDLRKPTTSTYCTLQQNACNYGKVFTTIGFFLYEPGSWVTNCISFLGPIPGDGDTGCSGYLKAVGGRVFSNVHFRNTVSTTCVHRSSGGGFSIEISDLLGTSPKQVSKI